MVHLSLINLTGDFAQITEVLRAYPIVPFFHWLEPESAMPVNKHVEDRDRAASSVPESVVEPLPNTVDGMLDVVESYFSPRTYQSRWGRNRCATS